LRRRAVAPCPIPARPRAPELLERMGGTASQARHVSEAARIWARALADPETTIFMGIAGALVPAGMRPVLAYLIEHRMVDCVVSTGANLFHDLYESLGGPPLQ